MDFGELLGKSWKEYKTNFSLFLKIFLLFYLLPSAIFLFITLFFIKQSASILEDGFANYFISLIPLFTGSLVVFLLSVIMTVSFIYIALFKKEKVMSFGQAVKGGINYYWRYIILSLLLIICLIPLFLLLIIPGIIFMIYWTFAAYILMGEDAKAWEAMKRSKAIVKGKWWRVFGYVILLGIIMWVISIPFSLPQGIYNLTTLRTSFSDMENLGTGFLIGSFIVGIISMLAYAITIPITTLFAKNFYLDLKKNKK